MLTLINFVSSTLLFVNNITDDIYNIIFSIIYVKRTHRHDVKINIIISTESGILNASKYMTYDCGFE